MKVAGWRGKRTLLVAHDVFVVDKKGIGHGIEKLKTECRNASVVVALSDQTLRDLEIHGIEAVRLPVLIPEKSLLGPVNKQRARRQILGGKLARQTGKLFLFFGQIRESKGLNILVEAFQRARETVPGIYLVIAGRNRDVQPGFLDEISRLANVVVENRYFSEDEKAVLFEAVDAVVLPYLQAYQSGVLVEAISQGVPVIASAVGNLSELVNEGREGVLVPPGDVESLTRALLDVAIGLDLKGKRESRDNESVVAQLADLYLKG